MAADLPTDGFYVLVTGANSGLGLGISHRLLSEFLHTRPQSQTLVLISTTRSPAKAAATTATLESYLRAECRLAERRIPGISMLLQRRVQFRSETLDLTSLVSVHALARKLRRELPRLDAVICNAGIGGWTGMNWPLVVWKIFTGLKQATTWPTYKLGARGWVTKPQLAGLGARRGYGRGEAEEPPLGEVFCANLFGHYVLGHALMPLLDACGDSKGRIIWISSIDACKHYFNLEDLQGLKSGTAYEQSKRLTDVLALTAGLPSTSPWTTAYLSSESRQGKEAGEGSGSRIYLTHPGICATSIFPLPLVLTWAMTAFFYIARWLGSQWHGITAIKGATAPVWVALADQSMLDSMEGREGKGKWGSATDWWGSERVERTEVEGWGWGGKVGEFSKRKGRWKYATELTEEDKESFEEVGRVCWKEMERLRVEWEERLEAAGMLE